MRRVSTAIMRLRLTSEQRFWFLVLTSTSHEVARDWEEMGMDVPSEHPSLKGDVAILPEAWRGVLEDELTLWMGSPEDLFDFYVTEYGEPDWSEDQIERWTKRQLKVMESLLAKIS